jgi:hypothetical protein
MPRISWLRAGHKSLVNRVDVVSDTASGHPVRITSLYMPSLKNLARPLHQRTGETIAPVNRVGIMAGDDSLLYRVTGNLAEAAAKNGA